MTVGFEDSVNCMVMLLVMLLYTRRRMGKNWILQQDNDPKHTSRHAKDRLEWKKISIMKRPAQSPNLSPIETLWNDVDRDIKKKKTEECVGT